LKRVNSPLLLSGNGQEQVHFDCSPEVTRGGCLVQTRFGIIDARRETKIELLKQAMQP
jgi:flagellar biosynthesis/type III secretory pathway protein FliH